MTNERERRSLLDADFVPERDDACSLVVSPEAEPCLDNAHDRQLLLELIEHDVHESCLAGVHCQHSRRESLYANPLCGNRVLAA